ncbi:MAG: hypothetical protein QOF91_1487 [Alphaproteobacteria bacterium]|nr:hypothetical protein [Alphaproteobacteria bacterium]
MPQPFHVIPGRRRREPGIQTCVPPCLWIPGPLAALASRNDVVGVRAKRDMT